MRNLPTYQLTNLPTYLITFFNRHFGCGLFKSINNNKTFEFFKKHFKLNFFCLIALLIFFCNEVYAKSEKVDDLIASPKEWQADILLSYTNINQKSSKTTISSIEIIPGVYTAFPMYAGDEKSNIDNLSYSLALKRGIIKNLEVFTFVNLFSDFQRITLDNQWRTKEEHKFSTFGIGTSCQILKEDKYPGLLLSISNQLIKNTKFSSGYKVNYLKSHSLSLTSYYTVDPIVFMLQNNYQLNLKEKKGTESIEPGDIGAISPQIYFSVNPYTILNWGVTWTMQGKDKVNGIKISPVTTDVSYNFGFDYEIKRNILLSVDAKNKNTADYSQSEITIQLNFKL